MEKIELQVSHNKENIKRLEDRVDDFSDTNLSFQERILNWAEERTKENNKFQNNLLGYMRKEFGKLNGAMQQKTEMDSAILGQQQAQNARLDKLETNNSLMIETCMKVDRLVSELDKYPLPILKRDIDNAHTKIRELNGDNTKRNVKLNFWTKVAYSGIGLLLAAVIGVAIRFVPI